MKPRIESLYIYKQKEGSPFYARFDKLSQRHNAGDFKFLRGNVPDIATDTYRYAQTFEIRSVSRTFLMITMESDKKKVDKFFEKVCAEIENDQKLFKSFKNANIKPELTSFTYGN